MSVTFNNNDKTYSVKSLFKRRFFRQDNGAPMSCCVEHDLIKGHVLCQNMNLTVNCKYVLFLNSIVCLQTNELDLGSNVSVEIIYFTDELEDPK